MIEPCDIVFIRRLVTIDQIPLLRIVKRNCLDRVKTKGGKNPDEDENKIKIFNGFFIFSPR